MTAVVTWAMGKDDDRRVLLPYYVRCHVDGVWLWVGFVPMILFHHGYVYHACSGRNYTRERNLAGDIVYRCGLKLINRKASHKNGGQNSCRYKLLARRVLYPWKR